MDLINAFCKFKANPTSDEYNLWKIILKNFDKIKQTGEKILRPQDDLLKNYPCISRKNITNNSALKYISLYYLFLTPGETTVAEMYDEFFQYHVQ